jgi:hypothetical protein
MRTVLSRIGKLEKACGVTGRKPPYVHHYDFVDGDGTITGTMVISDDPALREEYRDVGVGAQA